MRVLILAKKFPYPLKDGECIGIDRTAASLSANDVTVDLACINTLKHFTDPKTIDPATTPFTNIYSVTVDTNVKPLAFALSFFGTKSYNLQRFYSKEFESLLATICAQNKYDLIQLDGLYLYHYIPTLRMHSSAKIIMRAQNVEHEIWQKVAQHEKSALKKRVYKTLGQRMHVAELQALTLIDGLVTVTQADAEKFKTLGYRGAMHYLPIGMLPADGDTEFHQPLRLFHIGSMDWVPNVEGLKWFINDPWKTLHKAHPDLTLNLAGRNFPPTLFSDNTTVDVHGEVEDANQFMRDHDILIVPLFSGSGVRLKILEALAHGKVVISTAKGAEGIPYVNGKHLLIANSAEAFIEHVENCIAENGLVEKISYGAKELIRLQYDSATAGKELLSFYRTI